MRWVGSVRFRITAISTVLVAATLAIAALALMNLVRADLVDSAEATLEEALAQQAEEFGFGDDGFFPGTIDDGTVTTSFVPIELDGEVAELGLFTQEVDGFATGNLTIDDELVALVILDPVTGELIELIDPVSGEVVADEALVAEFDDLLFEVYFPEPAIQSTPVEEVDAALDDGVPLLVGATPLSEIEASIDALQSALLIIVPLLVVGFGLMSWFLVGRALRPVHAISDRVQAISTSSLDQRVPVPRTGDEVSELATVMNQMLARLEHGGERQRQFSADASHELRSPLATVRAAAELIEREGASERSTRLADEIVSETDRMDELIGDLLELSRLDEDRRSGATEPVDLVALVTAEVDRFGRDADPHVELVAEPAPVMIDAAPRQIRRLVTNLVDNARRHADGRVVVTAAPSTDGAPMLVVDDDGPGVPEYERERIFERFSRLDESRGRRAGGTGLGLALVRAIADRHGATVKVGRADLGGARFSVRFPEPPADGPSS